MTIIFGERCSSRPKPLARAVRRPVASDARRAAHKEQSDAAFRRIVNHWFVGTLSLVEPVLYRRDWRNDERPIQLIAINIGQTKETDPSRRIAAQLAKGSLSPFFNSVGHYRECFEATLLGIVRRSSFSMRNALIRAKAARLRACVSKHEATAAARVVYKLRQLFSSSLFSWKAANASGSRVFTCTWLDTATNVQPVFVRSSVNAKTKAIAP